MSRLLTTLLTKNELYTLSGGSHNISRNTLFSSWSVLLFIKWSFQVFCLMMAMPIPSFFLRAIRPLAMAAFAGHMEANIVVSVTRDLLVRHNRTWSFSCRILWTFLFSRTRLHYPRSAIDRMLERARFISLR